MFFRTFSPPSTSPLIKTQSEGFFAKYFHIQLQNILGMQSVLWEKEPLYFLLPNLRVSNDTTHMSSCNFLCMVKSHLRYDFSM